MSQFQPLEDARVDLDSGELVVSRQYRSDRPYRADTQPVQPTFADIRSIAGLRRFLDHVDRRTLVRANDCRRIYDRDKGNHHLQRRAIVFTNHQYGHLDRLVRQLDYANAVITTPVDLARRLGVRRNHLYRHLETLTPLVRVYGVREGMAKGSIRVDVSPAYGFRYPSPWFGLARAEAIQTWYLSLLQQYNTALLQ